MATGCFRAWVRARRAPVRSAPWRGWAQSHCVRLLAKLPAITACAPDLHARCKAARTRIILRAWPVVRACCWSCRSAILPCGPGCALDARGGGRSFCCVPLVYQPVPGSSQRGECSRQSQGLGCDPRIQCSGRTRQVRHRVNLESSGWHTLHPKFSFLLAELGQVAHGRIFEKKTASLLVKSKWLQFFL